MHEYAKSTPRQSKEFIIDALSVGLVPFLKSSPGWGKSSIIKQIAKQAGLKVLDTRLSTCAPEDLTGLPRFYVDDQGVNRATFAPFDNFPIEGTPVPEGYNGWLLFLDEFNSAPKSVQAAAYKLVLDREVGLHKLHENVAIVAAGNQSTDRAIVNPMSTAMQSRVVTINMVLNHKEFMEDVVLPNKWDFRVAAYLAYRPGALDDFRPDHNEDTFCCPRTWDFVNELIKGRFLGEGELAKKQNLLAGTITSGTAIEFVKFTEIIAELPDLKKIVSDPMGYAVPVKPEIRYSTVMYLFDHITESNLSPVCAYMNRFSLEFRILFFRGLITRHAKLRHNSDYINGVSELSSYLNS